MMGVFTKKKPKKPKVERMDLGPLTNELYEIVIQKGEKVLLRFRVEEMQKRFWKEHFEEPQKSSGSPTVRDSAGQSYSVTQFHESEGYALDFTQHDPRKCVPTIGFRPIREEDGSQGSPHQLKEDLEKWLHDWHTKKKL